MAEHRAALVDIDDTLADTQASINAYIAAAGGPALVLEDITEAMRNGEDAEYYSYARAFLQDPSLALDIPLYPNAEPALARLVGAGYEVHIATSRHEDLHAATEEWVVMHGLVRHITKSHPRYRRISSTDFKVAAATEAAAEVAFDDTLKVALALHEAGVDVYLIDKPWNHVDKLPSGIVRATDFGTAVDEFLAT